MDAEYKMERLLSDASLTPLQVFHGVLKIRDRLEPTLDGHPGYCGCRGCSWLYPVNRSETWHGTVNGYQYHKCRCGRCRKAVREYSRSRR